jgi:MFS family permease
MLLLGGLEWTAHAVGEHRHLWPALACTGTGLLALVYTWRHLQRTPAPVVSLAPLRHRSFALTATAGMVAMMSQHAMPFLLPLLFQLGLGMNAVAAGAMLLPYFLGNLAAKSVTTPLLKTFGFRRLALAATSASGACIACFAAVQQATPHLVLIGLLLCAGASRSVLMTVLNTLTFADITPAERGAASTLSTVWMQTASALAVAFGALCLAVAQMTHGGLVPTTLDFRITFAVLGLVCVSTLLGLRRLAPDTGAALTRHAS